MTGWVERCEWGEGEGDLEERCEGKREGEIKRERETGPWPMSANHNNCDLNDLNCDQSTCSCEPKPSNHMIPYIHFRPHTSQSLFSSNHLVVNNVVRLLENILKKPCNSIQNLCQMAICSMYYSGLYGGLIPTLKRHYTKCMSSWVLVKCAGIISWPLIPIGSVGKSTVLGILELLVWILHRPHIEYWIHTHCNCLWI